MASKCLEPLPQTSNKKEAMGIAHGLLPIPFSKMTGSRVWDNIQCDSFLRHIQTKFIPFTPE
jgi:hypothetical protein